MKKNEKNTSATIDQATKTSDGKIAVVVVERDSLTYYKDVKAPTMILKSDDFGALLNSILIARYADETSVKLTKSRKTLADAEKALKEYAGSDEGEIAALKAKIAAAQVNVKNLPLWMLRSQPPARK